MEGETLHMQTVLSLNAPALICSVRWVSLNYLLVYACTKFIWLCSFQILSKQTEASSCYQSTHDVNSDAPRDEMAKNASDLQEASVSWWRLPLNFFLYASRHRHLICQSHQDERQNQTDKGCQQIQLHSKIFI